MPKTVLILLMAIAAIGANSLLLAPIAPRVAEDLDAGSGTAVMRAAAAYGLGVMVSALLLAPKADRIGADRALVAALAVLCGGLALSAVAPNLLVLSGAQALAGAAAGLALPAIYTLATEIAPEGRAAQTLGTVLTGWTLSLVLGVSFAALVTDLVGWRPVYAVLAGLSIALVPPLWAKRGISAPSDTVTSPMTALAVPGIAAALMRVVLLMFAFYLSYFVTGLHVVEALGLGTAQAGLVPLSYGIGFGLAVLLDRYLDRIAAPVATPALFAAGACIYLALALAAPIFTVLAAVALVWGMTQHLCLNVTVARLTALDRRQNGAILGLYAATTYLCVFAAPLAGSWLFATGGFAACATVSALFAATEAWRGLAALRTARRAG